MAASCGYHIFESYLKNGAPNQEANAPIFIRARIQLAGDDLANYHTFKLLSGLLMQTLHEKNIPLTISPVNQKSFFRKKCEPGVIPAQNNSIITISSSNWNLTLHQTESCLTAFDFIFYKVICNFKCLYTPFG